LPGLRRAKLGDRSTRAGERGGQMRWRTRADTLRPSARVASARGRSPPGTLRSSPCARNAQERPGDPGARGRVGWSTLGPVLWNNGPELALELRSLSRGSARERARSAARGARAQKFLAIGKSPAPRQPPSWGDGRAGIFLFCFKTCDRIWPVRVGLDLKRIQGLLDRIRYLHVFDQI
jgi:hypothetical protein